MTNDLISRSALMERIEKDAPWWWQNFHSFFIVDMVETAPTAKVNGDTSDGYHTFNELYHHRAVLFSVICNSMPEMCWKSKKHHDGTMFDGMFIVGIDTPEGQATYHYDLDPYWNMFHVKEVDSAPEWDGHTPDEAIRRIGTLAMVKDAEPVRHGRWKNGCDCSVCGRAYGPHNDAFAQHYHYCTFCGAKMDGGKNNGTAK